MTLKEYEKIRTWFKENDKNLLNKPDIFFIDFMVFLKGLVDDNL